ncbi:MAG: NTP transferase domain-containing protein [Candidatus Paceibacterota bacterium]|jgi:bifunctional UDP-N-acetylglucosamine pyrophosphorylase/glucosamine-1-phosphate N-acetyltransferase
MEKDTKIKIIILAAGKGKRMRSELPKALIPLGGKPMIRYILDKIETLPFGIPHIVVGHNKEKIIKDLGDTYNYVVQEEQLGTGHAVNVVKTYIKDGAESIVILYGDQPFTSAETIEKLVEKQKRTKAKIVMATVKVPNFDDWRANFLGFSKVIRDHNGKIIRTVEKKDSTEEENKIKEVNPCYFCFDSKWLWSHLEKLKNDNAQKEYYLTDLIKMVTEEGIEIESIEIDAKEALGANTKEELEILENILRNKNS